MLSRQVKILAGFNGDRTCYHRLRKLIDAGYIKRQHCIYGVPSLYFATPKAKKIFDLEFLTTSVRIEQINHEIAVIDTAIWCMNKFNITELTTERELKNIAGFGQSSHKPDLIFTQNDKIFAVEVELNTKKNETFKKNVERNFIQFDNQIWVIPKGKVKIWKYIEEAQRKYSGIQTIELEEIIRYIKTL